MSVNLGILETHPIQYKAQWFRRLSGVPNLDLTVFYCMIPDARQQGEGFGVEFQWDVPLLDGYRYQVLTNVAADPSVCRFRGCDTPEIKDIVKCDGFDAFIVNGWVVKSCLQLLFACRKRGVPCIVRGESNALRRRAWYKRIVHLWLMRQYAAFLYIGRSNRDFYLRNAVPLDRLFFAPYCVDNEWFGKLSDDLRASREDLRGSFGIPRDATVVMFCGKLTPKKRPLDLLHAVDALANGCRDERTIVPHVLVVGDGELRGTCEDMATGRNLPVTFAGFLNQRRIVEAYAASDCLVLPSDYGETWGLVVNEAMACGIPAIVSDQVGCGLDLVKDGETGFTFKCGDIAGLASLLRRVATENGLLTGMGKVARSLIQDYSVASTVEGTLQAVEFVAASASDGIA